MNFVTFSDVFKILALLSCEDFFLENTVSSPKIVYVVPVLATPPRCFALSTVTRTPPATSGLTENKLPFPIIFQKKMF